MAVKKTKSLSSGRPPFSKKASTTSKSMGSSKATRSIIRKHHTLLKQHAKAVSSGDRVAAHVLATEISKDGGLEKYQAASQTGQLSDRGGDTSKVLVDWLKDAGVITQLGGKTGVTELLSGLKVLEIGCLSPDNAISKVNDMKMTRIDLRSNHASIEEQDFMARPLPKDADSEYDIVSLSLVLNYVPDPAGRGEMLLRTTRFLSQPHEPGNGLLPGLFLVLPLPCVDNSRYLTEELLQAMMESVGYLLCKSKRTTKMYYSMWKLDHRVERPKTSEPKHEVNPGKKRNNFCIVLDDITT
jgi:25S rRNA (adenine2142-N1)-methyltransferase